MRVLESFTTLPLQEPCSRASQLSSVAPSKEGLVFYTQAQHASLWWKQSYSRQRCCTRCKALETTSSEAREAVSVLLQAVEGTKRGVQTSSGQRSRIEAAVCELEKVGSGQVTTKGPIDATWKLIWTTEKETLFILKNAKLFGTEAGDVYQVIDTPNGRLQNVITFKNGASFVVDSGLEHGGDKRLVFKFTAARLNLPRRSWKFPPFGKGWFDTVYLNEDIRIAKDIRGDCLIVARDGPPRTF